MGKKYKALVLGFLFLCSVILPNFPVQKEAQAVEVAYTVPFSPWVTIKNLVWTNLTNGDTGKAFVGVGAWDTATVQVTGTFAGATLAIQGSNDIGDNPTWTTIANVTSAGITTIYSGYWQVRVSVSAGAGATLTATLVATQSTPDTKNLDDLLDVVTANPIITDVIGYDTATGKWINKGCGCGTGGQGNPGGLNTYVQFNDLTAFGGDAGFVYNKTTDTATLGALVLTTPLADASVADNITLTNLTQITTKSHTVLTDIGALPHATIDSYLNQAVKTTSSPVFTDVIARVEVFARTDTLTDGFVSLKPGSASDVGYVNWYKPGGERIAYMGFGDGANLDIVLNLNLAVNFRVFNGNFGMGITPTALFHIKPGTATANTAPFKLTAGTNLTTPEAGAVEYDTATQDLWFTNTTSRYGIISHITDTSDPHGATLTQTNLNISGRLGVNQPSPNINARIHVVGQYFSERFNNGNSGAALTFNCANSNAQSTTLTANCTLSVSNGMDGGRYAFLLKQDAIGSRTVTWWAGILWSGGTAPTLTTTPNKTDIITFVFDGTNWFGSFSLNY